MAQTTADTIQAARTAMLRTKAAHRAEQAAALRTAMAAWNLLGLMAGTYR